MSAEKIAIIGLGYVGLPLAIELAKAGYAVVGFEINPTRITQLCTGQDVTAEVAPTDLRTTTAQLTTAASALATANIFIITVPTPVDSKNQPDLTPLQKASATVAQYLKKGDIVVYESTVYPGVTEDVCGPILAAGSGLQVNIDFALGYSPERVSPGDKIRTLRTIKKIVAASTPAALERLAQMYGRVVDAGLHLAPTIKVAEAAKVIENIQRDVNIGLMNELAVVFARLGICTQDVLAAAGTKWNFLPFTPGLVGGHCIGVDPYYLSTRAEEVGVYPELIAAARRRNNAMAAFVAKQVVMALGQQGQSGQTVRGNTARVGILGVTFKENTPDLRNTKVPDVVDELAAFGIAALVADPLADGTEYTHEYPGKNLVDATQLQDLDVLILAVPHREILTDIPALWARVKPGGMLVDLKGALRATTAPEQAEKLHGTALTALAKAYPIPEGKRYWSL